jgi:predicted exporter
LLLALGVPLTLFHILALLLVASLGVDYSLFFTGYSRLDDGVVSEFRSVGVCCATSAIVFATLAFSSIPVLSAIGATVATGAVLSFLLTLCLSGRSDREDRW